MSFQKFSGKVNKIMKPLTLKVLKGDVNMSVKGKKKLGDVYYER